jgi:hypothetical protein
VSERAARERTNRHCFYRVAHISTIHRAWSPARASAAQQPGGPESAYLRLVLEALRAERLHPTGPAMSDYAGTYDVFFDRGESSRRIIFDRTAAGTIRGFELIYSSGHSVWFSGASVHPAAP